jgi:hypothetical protein
MFLGQPLLLGIAVGSSGASGNTLYWVLLVYVVPRNTIHCWVLLLVYDGPRTTLCWGIVVGWLHQWVVCLRGALGNTLYRVLLVYVALRATLYWVLLMVYMGYCCWFMWGIVVGYVGPWATQFLQGIVFGL